MPTCEELADKPPTEEKQSCGKATLYTRVHVKGLVTCTAAHLHSYALHLLQATAHLQVQPELHGAALKAGLGGRLGAAAATNSRHKSGVLATASSC